jgi:dCMP deaminase
MISHNDITRRAEQKIEAFANITSALASLSTSTKLKVGCIIFAKDFSKIASIGYNGAYRNAPIYEETGSEEESLLPGESGFIHAEINAIAKFREHTTQDFVVLVTHSPCKHCTKVLVNAGFKHIYWIEEYRDTAHLHDIFERTETTHGDLNALKKLYGLDIVEHKEYNVLSIDTAGATKQLSVHEQPNALMHAMHPFNFKLHVNIATLLMHTFKPGHDLLSIESDIYANNVWSTKTTRIFDDNSFADAVKYAMQNCSFNAMHTIDAKICSMTSGFVSYADIIKSINVINPNGYYDILIIIHHRKYLFQRCFINDSGRLMYDMRGLLSQVYDYDSIIKADFGVIDITESFSTDTSNLMLVKFQNDDNMHNSALYSNKK